MEKFKVCTKCSGGHPPTTEYFGIDKRNKNGLQARCRECGKKYNREYRQKHPDYHKKYNKEYQQTINGYLRIVYSHINDRCNNPKAKDYKRYGGRGIKCLFKSSDEFVNYVVSDLQVDPRGLQIDRIDNNGHYERGNIRFVTCKENCNNRGR